MTIQEFRDYMASGKPVVGGSDVHMMFHQLSQEALKITAEINGKYHTPEELHDLLCGSSLINKWDGHHHIFFVHCSDSSKLILRLISKTVCAAG